MHVDVGVYGHSKLPNFVGREKALRTFEKFTLEHKGYQALYAETLMPYEEFTEMFPRHLYVLVSIQRKGIREIYIRKIISFRLGKSSPELSKPSRRFTKKSVKLDENEDKIRNPNNREMYKYKYKEMI